MIYEIFFTANLVTMTKSLVPVYSVFVILVVFINQKNII
jgi:hypothetical protein